MLVEKRLAIAGGLVWGLSMFVLTFANIFLGYASKWLALMADIYPGYEVSYAGAFIGLAYGFIDGFIGLYVLAWIYNRINA